MQLGFYFDQQRCVGCYTCAVACKQWHRIDAGPASLRRVETREEGHFPLVQVTHLSISCGHCERPACVPACPTGAIRKRTEDGVVVVERGLCIPGCRSCSYACPYGAPQFRDDRSRMEKCDLCLDRIKENQKPLCVASCPLRALDVAPLEDLKRLYGGVQQVSSFPDPSPTRPAIIFRPRR